MISYVVRQICNQNELSQNENLRRSLLSESFEGGDFYEEKLSPHDI